MSAGLPFEGPWDDLGTQIRKNMQRFAKAATFSSACDRAGMNQSEYEGQLAELQRFGLKEAFEHYMGWRFDERQQRFVRNQTRRRDWRKPARFLTANLLAPDDNMRNFRAAAIANGGEVLMRRGANLPCFDEWFQDWVVPAACRGKRAVVGRFAKHRNGTVETMPRDIRAGAISARRNSTGTRPTHAGRMEEDAVAGPPLSDASRPHSTLFVPTAFQNEILKLLKGTSLRADDLQDKLHVDRPQLFRRGLRELKQHGRVLNNRRIGYYRPDSPPAKYSAFLGENIKSATELATEATE